MQKASRELSDSELRELARVVHGEKQNVGFKAMDQEAKRLKGENDKELAIVKSSLENAPRRVEFITYDESKMAGTFVRLPERNELNADINESLIVEFYNR